MRSCQSSKGRLTFCRVQVECPGEESEQDHGQQDGGNKADDGVARGQKVLPDLENEEQKQRTETDDDCGRVGLDE